MHRSRLTCFLFPAYYLLNYSEEQRRRGITSSRKSGRIHQYVFENKKDNYRDLKMGLLDKGAEHRGRFTRIRLFQALHESGNIALEWLQQRVTTALQGNSIDRESVHCRSVIAPYFSDIPECEDVLVVERDTITISPRQNCFLSRNEFFLKKTLKEKH